MPKVNRIGFTELGGSEGAKDKKVNVVLVHGLRGHPFETWTSSYKADDERAVGSLSRLQYIRSLFKSTAPLSESISTRQRDVFWPQDYLVEDIPQARIWTYGYNADVIGGLFQASGKDSVSQHGRNLAVRLEREVENEDPIIFVAHSLGGIIVKDAICRSEAGRRRTRSIVFLGTPHRGSGMAGWGEIASNLARLALLDSHKRIIQTLEVDGEVLDNIHEQFVDVVFEQGIRIHSFQEGRGMSGIQGLHEKVVSDFSSKLGLPKFETTESIDANHIQMARCNNRSDESYRTITGVLKQFLRGASSSADLHVKQVTQTQREQTPSAQQEAGTKMARVVGQGAPTPPLIRAAAMEDFGNFSSVLEREPHIMVRETKKGATPLHLAAGNGRLQIVQTLLEAGAEIDAKDFSGLTPLDYACQLGMYETAQRLLDHGAEMNTVSDKGSTPLIVAALNSRSDIVRLLLQRGADKAKRVDGWSALDVALTKSHVDTISALLEVD